MKIIFRSFHCVVVYLIPVLLMAGVIFYLSAQPGLKVSEISSLEIPLRKLAHFMEYGMLTILLAQLFFKGCRFEIERVFWIALFLSISYAISDEVHQAFVYARSARFIDVVVDSLGSLFALYLFLYFVYRKRSTEKVKQLLKRLLVVGVLFFAVVGYLIINNNIDKTSRASVNGEMNNSQKNEHIIFKEGEIKKVVSGEGVNKKEAKKIEKEEELPVKVYWPVPFLSQSPFAKWDSLHEETCEEASLVMLKYYNDKKKISKKVGEKELQDLVKYQLDTYGDFYDSDARTTKEIGEGFYKMDNLKLLENFTIDDLKRELVKGNVILIPTAGRELKNPNFSGAGPLYHNLVIVGYDNKKNIFITNDPGTRKGFKYKYDQELLFSAIHDFPGKPENILQGEKRAVVLVVSR